MDLEKEKETLNDYEIEVIMLNSIIDSIDECINNSIFELIGEEKKQILFETNYNQNYFNVQLVDFFSESKNSITNMKENSLDFLERLLISPKLNNKIEYRQLQNPIKIMKNWYNSNTSLSVNFTDIEKEVTLKLSRQDIVRICGNMTKHSIQHLTYIQKQLKNLLIENDVNIEGVDVRLLMNAFYSKFNTDYLLRYSSNIAKMLNDIRWSLYYYLLPVYDKSFILDKKEPPKYSYIYPENINSEYSKSIFWELMNKISHRPVVPLFDILDSFKDVNY